MLENSNSVLTSVQRNRFFGQKLEFFPSVKTFLSFFPEPWELVAKHTCNEKTEMLIRAEVLIRGNRIFVSS